jgi:hypothetical protein
VGEGFAAFGRDVMGPVFADRWEEGWPARDVDVDVLRVFVVAKEGLGVLPAVETCNISKLGLYHVVQGFTLSVTVDSTLDMSRLDLSTVKDNCAGFIDEGLPVLDCDTMIG